MRRLILLLFILSAPIFADGFYSAGSFSMDEKNTMFEEPKGSHFRTHVLIGAEYFGGYLEAEQNTSIVLVGSVKFDPYREEYYLRAGYRYKVGYIQYEHLCIHGVAMINPGGGLDRLTIGFDTRFLK